MSLLVCRVVYVSTAVVITSLLLSRRVHHQGLLLLAACIGSLGLAFVPPYLLAPAWCLLCHPWGSVPFLFFVDPLALAGDTICSTQASG